MELITQQSHQLIIGLSKTAGQQSGVKKDISDSKWDRICVESETM